MEIKNGSQLKNNNNSGVVQEIASAAERLRGLKEINHKGLNESHHLEWDDTDTEDLFYRGSNDDI